MHAAALPTSGLTALMALEAVNLRHYQTVLVIGATGGVGSYAVQMAARNEARVIATARPETEAYIRRLGAIEVIDYTQGDVVAAVKATHPEGIDVVIDVISDRIVLQHISQVLRHGGRLVTTVHNMDKISLARRDIDVIAVDVLGATGGLDELARMVDEGGITIPFEHVFPLEAAGSTLAQMKAGDLHGKIVLTIS
jgi:NADPH:quinone reductase-like Zn-dependent oxidoreductase